MNAAETPANPLADVVREIETHAARAGWDQPAQLFALVETADLLEREPQLAELLGVEAGRRRGAHPGRAGNGRRRASRSCCRRILWPPEVAGCAVVVEATTVPPGSADVPDDPEAAAEYAAAHPDREEARIVAGVLRTGESWCAIRQRAHDEDDMVLLGNDLVPALLQLLYATLEPDAGEPPNMSDR